ncbi:hypothetical protein GCM10007415_47680 [Parapedobacter pyrenivorans]|uniref:HTH araC/xylS-type domain-containing protein n=1 Tax=Parapedobacter pyrenivorans TaxID=1305674 RepID=A0A917I2A4_9SPHI|nr:AraC family transcriptional regulator [Parapedobacter pyrenivorans]GGH05708.1 hypothetical protein GCM10007415_47680 [Parapedobacter pyrenivorans]
MESLLVSVSLLYTLLASGFLLTIFFNGGNPANRYLALGLWTICLHVGYKLMWIGKGDTGLYEPPLPFGMLYPVLLYLFARTYYLPEKSVSSRQLLHLSLPFLLHLALFVVASLQSVENSWTIGYAKAYYVSCAISLVIYAVITARLYNVYKGPATATDILIHQLTMLCFGLVVLSCMVLYEVSVAESEIGFEVRPMVYLFLIVGLTLIARYVIFQRVPIFRGYSGKGGGEVAAPHSKSIAEWAEIIERELNRTRLYLNPSVSLDMLAQQTAIPRHQLTQVFNGYYKKSFYQFIAVTRIEYAIQRILERDDTVTLDSLSYECGFNSKTSFNRYFKAYTGMTPSEYRSMQRTIADRTLCISP